MGRSLDSVRAHLRVLMAEWAPFAEPLTRQEQEDLAWLWQSALRHASAVGEAERASPMEAVLLAMLLESVRRARRLEARVERLEEGRAPAG